MRAVLRFGAGLLALGGAFLIDGAHKTHNGLLELIGEPLGAGVIVMATLLFLLSFVLERPGR